VRQLVLTVGMLFVSTTVMAKPNVVLILTDDQDGTGSISYMPKVRSLLAEQGITFTNSFVNLSLCAPSRASFLTGQAAHNHEIISDGEPHGGWLEFRSKETNTLPVWLQAAGYRTALLGKYMNGYGEGSPRQSWFQSQLDAIRSRLGFETGYGDSGGPNKWVPPGWDLWFAFARASYYNELINENGKILRLGDRAEDYSTDVLRDRAARFIQEQSQSSKPFFMIIATKAPHLPCIPSPKYEHALEEIKLPMSPAFNEPDVSGKPPIIAKQPALDDQKIEKLQGRYRNALRTLLSVDDLVEGVVDALRSAGKLDNTIIVYTSDNGMSFGDHRLVGKESAYESSIRVPLVMRGPGIPKGEERAQLVNNLDVVATIEQLTGTIPGIEPDGRSLVPLFTDPAAKWRSRILVEAFGHRQAAVRTATWKYIAFEDGFDELYDLSVDPYELENKAHDSMYASELTSLRATLKQIRGCSASSCWVP
jgi:N-acetylglucosamine-6-sulfatase